MGADPFVATLAAEARLLEAAERDLVRVADGVVGADETVLELLGHAHQPGGVRGVEVGGKAIRRCIGISTLAVHSQCGKIGTMLVSDSVLLIFLAVAAVIHLAGITILGWLLRESLRITRAVGALVIQEDEKTRRLFGR